MGKVNFGIIGFGSIARTHAMGAYGANLQFSLPYLLNLKSYGSRRPIEDRMPPGAKNVSIGEVLEDKEIDFVDICTPNDSHKKMVFEAIKYGKAIYCEKPLASNYKEAAEMAEAVESHGVKNAVAFMYRYMPAVRLIREAIEEGEIGDIVDFKIKLYHKSYLDSRRKGAWRTKVESGGGALMDIGIHLIDIVHFTLGDIKSVSCVNRIHFSDRTSVDEITQCRLYLSQGVEGSMEASRIFVDSEEPTVYVIYGTKGSLTFESGKPYSIKVYNYEKDTTEIRTRSKKVNLLEFYPKERCSLGPHQDCHMASLISMANMVFEDRMDPIVPTFSDALKAQRVVEASYISASENMPLCVEDVNS